VIIQVQKQWLDIGHVKNGNMEFTYENLRKWFGRKGAKGKTGGWVDCNSPDGKGGYKPCGRKKGEKRKYPACRPTPAGCKDKGKGKKWGKKSKKEEMNLIKENENCTPENILLCRGAGYDHCSQDIAGPDGDADCWCEGDSAPWGDCGGATDEKPTTQNISKGPKRRPKKLREELIKAIREELSALKEKKKKKSSSKKDACYHKVKRRYKVWPSAYASGALSKCRKVGAANWGNKSKKK